MEINAEMYNWLASAEAIKDPIEPDQNYRYKLDESTAMAFENGLGFTPLIKRLKKVQGSGETASLASIDSLNDVKNLSSKLHNWKVLSAALEPLGVKVDPDSRSLIIAGDREMVVEVLAQIKQAEKLKPQIASEDIQSEKNESRNSRQSIRTSVKKKNTGPKKKGSLFIDDIQADTLLADTETCLEYLLVSFCKEFSLRPKQAAGLLTQNGKYLAYVVRKGLKGKHGAVVLWYQSIYNNLPHLLKLISQEEANGSIPLILSSLNSGLLSKNLDTVLWCCRLFSKIGADFFELDMLPPAWDWFVSEGSGLENCLLACRRFGVLVKAQIVSVLTQFGRGYFTELFTIQLRNYIPENISYFTTINELLQNFWEIKASKDELLKSGTVSYWIELGLKEANADGKKAPDLRLASLNFICDIWLLFPGFVDAHEDIANEILNAIKKALRDKFLMLRFACIGKFFQLLENFTAERNPFAPVVYKTLTFYLVENYRDQFIREAVLNNFCLLFEGSQSIPVGILLEPLVKQLQVASDIIYSVIDFEFFIKVSSHPRLTLKNAVQTMDALGKIYMNEEIYNTAAAIPFMMLASRFVEESSVQEYLYRLAKYSLIYALKFELNRRKNKEIENEWEARQIYQRDMMLEMTERIIKLRVSQLNERILADICNASKQLTKHGKNNKFVMVLLKLFGDPKEILELNSEEKPTQEPFEPSEEVLMDIETQSLKGKLNKNAAINKPAKKLISSSSAGSLQKLAANKNARAMLEIEKIRQNMIEREVARRLKEEKDKINLAKRKKVIRQQIGKKRLNFGNTKNEKYLNAEVDSIDSNALKEISEEERELINYILKRYLRVLKFLFKKYSSTGYSNTRVGKDTFDTAAEKNSALSESEFYKLLKEQGVTPAMISLDESNSIMKAICQRMKKPQVKVNFIEYKEMVIQTAIFIYSRPPKDYSHFPPAVPLKLLFEHFRSSATEKGVPSRFYEEFDPGVGDREIISKLNMLLEKDPNTLLPEGFRKVLEHDIDIEYRIPEQLEFTQAQTVAISILDELLAEKVGVHFLEPVAKVTQITRVQGVLLNPQINRFGSSSSEMSVKFNTSYHPAQLVNELSLTAGIKFEVTRLSGKYPKEHLLEAAKLLDDLIFSVDSGSLTLVSRNNRTKVLNKVHMDREESEKKKKEEAEAKEKQRKQRKKFIEEHLKRIREQKEQKQKEEIEHKQHVEILEKERKQKLEEKRRKMKKKRENEIEEWKKKKGEEDEKKKKVDEEKRNIIEELRKKKREQFLKSIRKNIHDLSAVKHDQKVEEEKRKVEMEKLLNKQKKSKKTLLANKITVERARKEEGQKSVEEFNKIKSDPNVIKVFHNMEKAIETIFTHYCKTTPSRDGTTAGTLSQQGFTKFCVNFNIVPALIRNENCSTVFKLTLKNKKVSSASFSLHDFEEALLRLIILCQPEIEKELNVVYKSNEDALTGFFNYLSIVNDTKILREMLKNIDMKSKNLHPKEKKKMKNQLNLSISRELTPTNKSIRKINQKRLSNSEKRLLKPEMV